VFRYPIVHFADVMRQPVLQEVHDRDAECRSAILVVALKLNHLEGKRIVLRLYVSVSPDTYAES
jgi:hypothetical protein